MPRPRTLLLIDDDPDDIQLFTEAANKVDPSVECRSMMDGEQALKALREPENKPDIIFLDLNMPRLTGRECLKEIKRMDNLSRVPVLIYTTSSYEKDLNDVRVLGASYFFTKPSSFNALCKLISDVISENVVYFT